jgi:hypothetical protein
MGLTFTVLKSGMNTSELWKPIKEFPDYAVSNLGRVRRTVPDKRSHRMKVLKPNATGNGYSTVALCKDGLVHRRLIHRLVLVAFLGPDLERTKTNHRNGDKTDNRITNLEWCTASENELHSYYTLGKKPQRGEEHGMAKLTEDQVIQIRSMPGSHSDIAMLFGVSGKQISNIKSRHSWRHL